jgi:hypothetical protein
MTPAEMPGSPDPRDVVARGYDRIAERYAEWARNKVDDTVAPAYLRLLIERFPRGAAVLDSAVAAASGWHTWPSTSRSPRSTSLGSRCGERGRPSRGHGCSSAT